MRRIEYAEMSDQNERNLKEITSNIVTETTKLGDEGGE